MFHISASDVDSRPVETNISSTPPPVSEELNDVCDEQSDIDSSSVDEPPRPNTTSPPVDHPTEHSVVEIPSALDAMDSADQQPTVDTPVDGEKSGVEGEGEGEEKEEGTCVDVSGCGESGEVSMVDGGENEDSVPMETN